MIDRVSVSQDDEGEWWLEFYADDIRYGVSVAEILALEIAAQHSAQRTPLTLFGMRVEIANWLKPGQWFIRPPRR